MILLLAAIMFSGFVLFIALWFKAGKEGRFMVWENIFRVGGAVGIFRLPSGQAVLRHLKSKGRSLIHGKSGFAFMPGMVTNPKETKKQGQLNRLIETKTLMCNKPLYTGSVAASLAAVPSLNEAIANAKRDNKTEEIKFLENLKTFYPEGVKELHLITPWSINELEEYVNISYTDADIDEAYQEGYLKGLSSYEKFNKVLLALVVIMLIALIASIFWLTK
jgi:hypothetical protein